MNRLAVPLRWYSYAGAQPSAGLFYWLLQLEGSSKKTHAINAPFRIEPANRSERRHVAVFRRAR